MVSKNNKKELINRLENKKLHYTIKKLKVGVGSVVIGSSLIFGSQAVLANESLDNNSTLPEQSESSPSIESEKVTAAVGEQILSDESQEIQATETPQAPQATEATEATEATSNETHQDVPTGEDFLTPEALNEVPQVSGENNHSSRSRVTRQAPEISGVSTESRDKAIDDQINLEISDESKPRDNRELIGGEINDRISVELQEGSEKDIYEDVQLEVVVPKTTPNNSTRRLVFNSQALRRQQEILDTVDHFIRRINLGALTKGSKFTIPYTLSVGRPQSEGENVDIDHSIHFKLLNKDKRVISELSKQYTQNKRAVADYFDRLSVSQQYTKLPDGQVKVGAWETSKMKKHRQSAIGMISH